MNDSFATSTDYFVQEQSMRKRYKNYEYKLAKRQRLLQEAEKRREWVDLMAQSLWREIRSLRAEIEALKNQAALPVWIVYLIKVIVYDNSY